MNNDLERFSEERLKLLELKVNYPTWDEISALARIALAVKQAKPVVNIEPLATAIMKTIDAETDKFHSAYTLSELRIAIVKTLSALTTPQPAHAGQIPDICGFDPALAGSEATVITNYFTLDGWRLVPIEPNAKMIGSASGQSMTPIKCWEVMLAAAPKPDGILINEDTQSDGWIKCSDGLPDETEDADGGAIGYLVRYENDRVPNGGFNIGVSNVVYLRKHWRGLYSHWMPLPAAPKPESE